MEASDEEFDTEEVRKLVKRLDELDPIPLVRICNSTRIGVLPLAKNTAISTII